MVQAGLTSVVVCDCVWVVGSLTLHHWQRLATPHLGGFLDPRPGVQIKGERPLEMDEEEVFCLSDYEEDTPGMSHDISHEQSWSHDIMPTQPLATQSSMFVAHEPDCDSYSEEELDLPILTEVNLENNNAQKHVEVKDGPVDTTSISQSCPSLVPTNTDNKVHWRRTRSLTTTCLIS